MDVFFIAAVTRELAERLPGARVNKIHQPFEDLLIVRLWTGREDLRLLLGAGEHSRLHLTTRAFPNPFTPPRFCQLLRSRLAALTGIDQVPGERVVRLTFRGREAQEYVLWAELTGRRANLILADGQGRVVDALKRIDGGEEGRTVLPGRPYRLPSPPAPHFLGDGLPEIPPECASGEAFRKWLLAAVRPMSPLLAGELAARVEGGASPGEVLASLRQTWLAGDFQPMIATLNGKEILCAFRLTALAAKNPAFFASPSQAADHFYADPAYSPGERSELEAALRRAQRRLAARLEKIGRERERLADHDVQRRLGELLLANLHQLRRGMEEVVVEDWYRDPPEPIAIRLDPKLSPQENAEAFFRRSRKGKRGLSHVDRRLAETREELGWLDEAALALEEAREPRELLPIRQELEEAGIIRPCSGPNRRRQAEGPEASVRRAESPGGFTLFWGKNNRGNDHVSRHLTSADDLWFHAHRLPGCHLVLKRGDGKGEIPEEDLLFAAALAAGYSRGKNDTRVEVMVTEGKRVRKPKGARPGLVVVESFRTVRVAPRRVD